MVGHSDAEPAPEAACAARTPAPAQGKENREGQAVKAEPGGDAGESGSGAGRSASGAQKTPAAARRAGAPLAGMATPGPTPSPFTPCAISSHRASVQVLGIRIPRSAAPGPTPMSFALCAPRHPLICTVSNCLKLQDMVPGAAAQPLAGMTLSVHEVSPKGLHS